MSWKKWFPEYAVPRRLEALVTAGALRDETWKEDGVPHFEAVLRDGIRVVLWVDHPKRSERFIPDGPRYGIEVYVPGKIPETVFESDDLRDTLEAVKFFLSEGRGLRPI